jgi:hypothetical protein
MIPAGYLPHTRRSPLTDPWEPLFARETADAVQLDANFRMVGAEQSKSRPA